MNRTLLALAFVAAASPASAQAPAPDTEAVGRMNTRMGSGSGSSGERAADTAAALADMTGPAATAQKRIEMDGYTDVHGLAKGADGLWRGAARKGGRSVEVTVDRAGRVAEQ